MFNSLIVLLALSCLLADSLSKQLYLQKQKLSYFLQKTSTISSQSNQQTCIAPLENTGFTIGLGNCQQNLYYITLGVGTPPQYFNLQFDTGSDVLWLPTSQANSQGFVIGDSMTIIQTGKPGSIEYVNGAGVIGDNDIDYVTLPNTAINSSTTVLLASSVTGLSLAPSVLGVSGMGYSNNKNFLDIAYRAGQIQTNTFSLALRGQNETSILYYDKIPSEILNNSLFSDVYGFTDYWQVNLIGFFAGDNDWTSIAPNRAVIDSGTTLFYLNSQLQQLFISTYLIPQGCNITEYSNICNSSILNVVPTLSFQFPGVQVYLQPSDYVQCFGSNNCYVNILQTDVQPPEILLGDTLFMKYTITFNKEEQKIGFQGNTKVVNILGSGKFLIAQYVMIGIQILLVLLISITAICFIPAGSSQILQNVAVDQNLYKKTRRQTQLTMKLKDLGPTLV